MISLLAPGGAWAETNALERPNVIVILTDDQGYGDIGAHGHPFLRTPNMDKLYAESVRFTDFHVAPMCSPTRGELMTGVDAMKNGCTAVCQGRSMVREDIPMLPNYFKDAGYATGIFGKWHLGDSYPYRPQDRGFQEVLSFRAWGLPSLASNWENSSLNPNGRGDEYTDPMLAHNGVDTLYPGYSGDIFFTEAMKYMAECQGKKRPFFVYLADNLAHVPDRVPSKYSEPYEKIGRWKGIKVPAQYYGMIANIDENLGRLEAFLVKQALKKNTILLFLSDNGTRSVEASRIYNGGMRGHKTELWDGGHRVHCFFRWPQSGIQPGRDITELTEVQDIAPTLLDLCRIYPTNLYPMSGVSLAELLRNQPWPHADRAVAIQYKISGAPWVGAVVPYEKWRLLAGKKLYNVAKDPHQDRDAADENAGVLKFMNTYYDAWHREALEEFQKPRYIHLGHPGVPEVILYASDWQGDHCDNPANLAAGNARGAWDIEVESAGIYRVELSRWPFESGKALAEGVQGSSDQRGARPIAQATLKLGDDARTVQTISGQKLVAFDVRLKAGRTRLATTFANGKGQSLCGAFYVRVTRRTDQTY
ncbi:MAG: arylsulfatase [Verrucomicrobiota bacterium]